MYQPPLISCEQAQENANAIYKYPIALKSLTEKDEIIKTRERELYFVKSSFEEERRVFVIDLGIQTAKAEKQERRKKRWRFATGVLAIVAGAFYLK